LKIERKSMMDLDSEIRTSKSVQNMKVAMSMKVEPN